jgi:alkanesulfonate monooxygenase SsuD/methylene tetrahydromethanopterin reductase-like flavin-dependent oxidoreductase (luciferase family)
MVEGQEGVTWPQWVALARACEAGGLEGLFRSDHYLSVFDHGERGSLDAWATICALAAVTERIRLGTLVSPVTFRRVSVLAKVVATADHVSVGRVELGLGAGWNEHEHEVYGFAFPELGERMRMLEHQLAELTRQWAELPPAPVQRPHPPLLMGGAAGPRASALAARFADEYNTPFATPEECRERRARIVEACEAAGREPLVFSLMTACIVGRDRAEVEQRARRVAEMTGGDAEDLLRSDQRITGTVDEVVARLREYEQAGVQRVFLQHLDHEDVEMVRLIGDEVVPAVAAS